MKAVLYICHGSRLKTAKRRGDSIYYIVHEPYRSDYSRSLFLELANPSIEDGFRTCVKRGATEIIAIPVFY